MAQGASDLGDDVAELESPPRGGTYTLRDEAGTLYGLDAGLAAALYGLAPRLAAPVTWMVLVALVLLEVAWEFQIASQAWFDLSPFAHVHYSVRETPATPLVWLTGLAAALTATGVAAFQRRDIA
jgi:ABC-2 type transport system permease protein